MKRTMKNEKGIVNHQETIISCKEIEGLDIWG